MESTVITTYIDKIYQFAWNKSFDEEEAEELSQEILYAAVKSLPLLRDESRFEPWLWSLAQNTARTFRRKQGRQRAMFVYDAPEMLMQESDLEDVDELFSPLMEEYAELVNKYITGYKKLFPKHLADDAQRMCRAFFVGFYDTVSTYCVKKGMLVQPEKNWICDVLLEWDGK